MENSQGETTKAKESSQSVNRPFSKMAAENSIKLKLAKIKNVYHH